MRRGLMDRPYRQQIVVPVLTDRITTTCAAPLGVRRWSGTPEAMLVRDAIHALSLREGGDYTCPTENNH
jgi:hypothetical protein